MLLNWDGAASGTPSAPAICAKPNSTQRKQPPPGAYGYPGRKLIGELYRLLARGRLVEGANLLLTRQGNRLAIQIMAISTGTLGVLLASLADPRNWTIPAASHADHAR